MNQYFTAVNSFSSLFKPVHSLINTANFRSRIEYFPTEIQFLLRQRKNSLLSIPQTRSLYPVDIIVTIDVWLVHIPFRQVHHFLIPKRLIIPEVRVLCHACISQKMILTRGEAVFCAVEEDGSTMNPRMGRVSGSGADFSVRLE